MVILEPDNGRTAYIGTIGGFDETWYNPGDRQSYLASRIGADGPRLAVIDAVTEQPTSATFTGVDAHSVAVNSFINDAYVPMGPNPADTECRNGCIGVFGSRTTRAKPMD